MPLTYHPSVNFSQQQIRKWEEKNLVSKIAPLIRHKFGNEEGTIQTIAQV